MQYILSYLGKQSQRTERQDLQSKCCPRAPAVNGRHRRSLISELKKYATGTSFEEVCSIQLGFFSHITNGEKR